MEQWAPDYGSPMDEFDANKDITAKIDADIEKPAGQWAPIPAKESNAQSNVLFIDGVRRIEAVVWLSKGPSDSQMAFCASCAAGVVRCDGRATVVEGRVSRVLVGPGLEGGIQTKFGMFEPRVATDGDPGSLMNRLAEALSELEVEVARSVGSAPLIVIDGPLRGRERIDGAIGYVKTHRANYLPPELNAVVAGLAAGERTPVFLFETNWTRYSWYMRLPYGKGHPWAGIVRCEAPSTLSTPQVCDLANAVVATLPKFASQPHKDSRAPQNLYPIAGLENQLRHRLGASEVLFRAISEAAASQPAS